MKFLNRILNTFRSNEEEITDELVSYYRKNPDELDLIINREHFNALYLGVFFALGLGTTITARVIQYYFGNVLGEFVSEVVLDVLSELGIAIFGGAVVAFLIEHLNKKQYQQNIRFRKQIKSRLKRED